MKEKRNEQTIPLESTIPNEKIRIARCAIILNEKGEVLLSKRDKDPFRGKWAFVSGKGKENIHDEVICDLGTKATFEGEEKFSYQKAKDSKLGNKVLVFVGHLKEGSEITPQSGESASFEWVTLEEASKRDLAFEHNEILKEYLSTIQ